MHAAVFRTTDEPCTDGNNIRAHVEAGICMAVTNRQNDSAIFWETDHNQSFHRNLPDLSPTDAPANSNDAWKPFLKRG